jgi:beta-phosphoglucomutase
MIQTIILDFDGVILESVSVKTEAFRQLFSDEREYVDEIVQFHLDNGGMSRFEKFSHIYTNILQRELTSSRFQELSDEFSELVFHEVVNAPFVPGAYEFLEKFHTKIPQYVVSATPENELIAIIREKGLTRYFRKIYGSPRKKNDCIREILASNNTSPSSVIFVGDAINDWNAARSAHVRFIGRNGPCDMGRFKGCIGVEKVVADMHELGRYIGENL